MALYEHVFLARQDISSQQVDALVEQYRGVLEANGGSSALIGLLRAAVDDGEGIDITWKQPG